MRIVETFDSFPFVSKAAMNIDKLSDIKSQSRGNLRFNLAPVIRNLNFLLTRKTGVYCFDRLLNQAVFLPHSGLFKK